jgi:hypothetical protein
VLAAAAMGFYFWRQHSEIEYELRHAFDVRPEPGDEEEIVVEEVAVVERRVGGGPAGGPPPRGTPIR